MQRFWAVASAGKTLCLLDGVYQGDANMLRPPSGMSGVNGRPIVVRALNDGGATIDGQFAREPFTLYQNSWWVFEGFNVKSSSRSVISIGHGTGPSNYNVLRRMVAWDANMAANEQVVLIWSSEGNLLEDVAMFGTGRKIYLDYGLNSPSSVPNVCRRCWGRWEGSITYGPKQVYSQTYSTFNNICENCFGTWSAEQQPQSYTVIDGPGAGRAVSNYAVVQAYGILSMDGEDTPTTDAKTQVFGSLAYIKATDRMSMAADPFFGNSLFGGVFNVDNGAHYRHTMSIVSPSNPAFATTRAWVLGQYKSLSDAANITSVRSAADVVTWSVRNVSAGTSMGSVASPWTATDTGANLCYRWINGAQTTTPLWPWPMNERIKAATAAAGAYTGPCPTCVGGRTTRTATDVTADVEALLGTIPSQCRM